MGDYLVSSSYDSTTAIWACPGFLPVKTLPHSGKLMSLDVSGSGDYIATTSYDRVITLWGPELPADKKEPLQPPKTDVVKEEPIEMDE